MRTLVIGYDAWTPEAMTHASRRKDHEMMYFMVLAFIRTTSSIPCPIYGLRKLPTKDDDLNPFTMLLAMGGSQEALIKLIDAYDTRGVSLPGGDASPYNIAVEHKMERVKQHIEDTDDARMEKNAVLSLKNMPLHKAFRDWDTSEVQKLLKNGMNPFEETQVQICMDFET